MTTTDEEYVKNVTTRTTQEQMARYYYASRSLKYGLPNIMGERILIGQIQDNCKSCKSQIQGSAIRGVMSLSELDKDAVLIDAVSWCPHCKTYKNFNYILAPWGSDYSFIAPQYWVDKTVFS